MTTNKTGVKPLEYNVIVEPDEVEGRTAGGVILPDQVVDRSKASVMRGRVVAASPFAFTYDDAPTWDDMPKPGDVVWIKKYSGGEFTGVDGNKYWFVKDKDVMGVVETATVDA